MAAKIGSSLGKSSCAMSQASTVATETFTACSSGTLLEDRIVAGNRTSSG